MLSTSEITERRVVVVGRPAWCAAMAASLSEVGVVATAADNIADIAADLGCFEIAFIDLEHADPLRFVADLWWVEHDLPAVLCGDDCDLDFQLAATEAGIVVVTPALPPLERIRALVDLLTGALRKNTTDRSRAFAHAMGALCSLGVDGDSQRSRAFGDAIVPVVAELFHADVVSLLLTDDAGALRTVATVGLDPSVIGTTARTGGPGEYVLKTGIARLIIGDAREAPTQLVSTSKAQASMIVPIIGSGQVVRGVLTVAKRQRRALFTPRDLELCSSVATLVAQLLERDDAARQARRLQQQLEASERLTVLGELAAGVVHDVAAPLGSVRANVETLISYLAEVRPLLEASEDMIPGVFTILEDMPALLCETYEGLTIACNVIRQMKQVVHLGSTANSEDVDISATVDSAIRMLRSRVRTPVEIVADEHCHIRGVAIEMLQVVTNLVTNANDACVERKQRPLARGEVYRPRIEVATRYVGKTVVISVSDNGVGMSAEIKTRMWEQLFTTKAQGLRTGLGMSVVRRIVREHGGEVEVTSTPGLGTTFHLVMPCTPGSESNRLQGEMGEASTPERGANLYAPEHLLVV